ncbi:MAG: metalloregulator ArsR/SmtB family transcription factor [Nanoarchaeota archaeon]|nr:metalloregulator ArsR/SmtB family transcription factor [Nanoarchaeota archaeon]
MKCPSYNMFFETISSGMRMKIIYLLMARPMSVNDICSSLKEEQSKVSHNLKKLISCNVVEVEQRGKNRIYSLNKKTIVPLMKLVEKHVKTYCGNKCTKK